MLDQRETNHTSSPFSSQYDSDDSIIVISPKVGSKRRMPAPNLNCGEKRFKSLEELEEELIKVREEEYKSVLEVARQTQSEASSLLKDSTFIIEDLVKKKKVQKSN